MRNFILFLLFLFTTTLPMLAQDFLEFKTIIGSDIDESSSFGYSIDSDGDYLVVGAPRHNSDSGAVYIFFRNEGGENNWGEVAKLTISNESSNWFGSSVSISDGLILVGSRSEDSQNVVPGAYLFSKIPGSQTWTLQKNLTADVNQENGGLFSKVSIYGDNAIVGNPNSSVVYHFSKNTGGDSNWGLQNNIIGGTGTAFGQSAEIYGLEFIIGSVGGTNANGLAFIFELDGSTISSSNDAEIIHPNDIETNSGYGQAVSISEVGFAIGAPKLDGDQYLDQGATYINDEVKLIDEIQHPNRKNFGQAVDMDGDIVMIGAENRLFFYEKNKGGTDNWGLLNIHYKYNSDLGTTVSLNDFFAFSNFENTVIVYKRANINVSDNENFIDQRLNFQNTGVFQTSTIELEVTNVSEITQQLSTFSTSESSYSFSFENPLLSPDASTTIRIDFTPQKTGSISDTLIFRDTEGIDYPIMVRGTGIVPHVIMDEQFSEVSSPSFINVIFQLSDNNGNWLSNFNKIDLFEIEEDNSPISPTEALPQIGSVEDIPLTVKTALILDNSFSIGANLGSVKQAATIFVENKFPEQKIAVYSFAENILLLQDYTSNIDSLKTAISNINLGPASTNLFGSVIEGMGSFEPSFSLNEIIQGFGVLFTDGEDTQGLNTIEEALNARGNKRLITVGVGPSADLTTLNSLQNAGAFAPSDFDELPEVFTEIQEDIIKFANSFYWFSYVSPKRGDNSHFVDIRIKNNPNVSFNSFIQTQFSSNGFSSVNPGVYINRSFSKPLGIDTMVVTTDGPIKVDAQTLFHILTPSYSWSSNNTGVVNIQVDNQDNSIAYFTPSGSVSQSAEITVTDTENGYNKTFLYTINSLITSSEKKDNLPTNYKLFQNYPNPFNPNTNISFSISKSSNVNLRVYDINGRLVSTIVNKLVSSGIHHYDFDASNLSSGVYFYQLRTDEFTATQKMLLIK